MDVSTKSPAKTTLADDWWIRKRECVSQPNVPQHVSDRIAQNPIMISDLAQTAAARHFVDRGGELSVASALMKLRLKGISKPPSSVAKLDKAKQPEKLNPAEKVKEPENEKETQRRNFESFPSEVHAVRELDSDEEITILDLGEPDEDENPLVIPMNRRDQNGKRLKKQSIATHVESTKQAVHLPAPRRVKAMKGLYRTSDSPVDNSSGNASRVHKEPETSAIRETATRTIPIDSSSSGDSIPLTSGLSRAVVLQPKSETLATGMQMQYSSNSSFEEEDVFFQSESKLAEKAARASALKAREESLAHDEYLEFCAHPFRGDSPRKQGRKWFWRRPHFLRAFTSSS